MINNFNVLIFVIALSSSPAFCQESTSGSLSDESKLKFFDKEPIRNGFMYFPYGYHTASRESGISTHNLVGVTYKAFSVAYFENSYGGDSFALAHSRNVVSYGSVGAELFYGIMYGYHGKLAEADNMPKFLKPFFESEINPVATVSPYWKVTDRLELRGMVTPVFLTLGAKFSF